MKPLKKAIRFFEKYPYETADKMLFDLFKEWKKSTNPSIHIERSVYLSVCAVRELLNEIWLTVQKGESVNVVLYLEPKPDIEVLRRMATKKRTIVMVTSLEAWLVNS